MSLQELVSRYGNAWAAPSRRGTSRRRPLRIGFDVSQTGPMKAGCGNYAYGMITSMLESAPQHRFSLFPSFGDFYFDVNMPRENPFPGRNVEYGPGHSTLEEARAFWTSPGLEQRLGGLDVVHSNNYWCPPAFASTRLVYTLYDLSFVANPSWTTEINRAACWEGVSRAASNADWIVAISNASRNHFLELFPQFPPRRIRVIYPCSRFSGGTIPGRQPAALAGASPGGFWLSVGTIEPRKNQRRIAEAYAQYLSAGGEPMPLVFVGRYGWMMEDFHRELAALDISAKVVFTGYVDDAELAWLYRNCRANIYTSHFEGFGLPVLEGMEFGAPTIASDCTALREIAGDAAILVKPGDTEELARAMLHVARSADERARLARRAAAQAALFDPKQSAASLLTVYGEAVDLGSRHASA